LNSWGKMRRPDFLETDFFDGDFDFLRGMIAVLSATTLRGSPVRQFRTTSDSVYVPVVGKPGDVFFFDCNILHGSGHNMSPTSRKTLIYACAEMDNRPKVVENPRPDWVVAREFEPFTEHIE